MEEKENTGTRASSEEGLKFPEGAAAPRASDEDRTLVFPESAAAPKPVTEDGRPAEDPLPRQEVRESEDAPGEGEIPTPVGVRGALLADERLKAEALAQEAAEEAAEPEEEESPEVPGGRWKKLLLRCLFVLGLTLVMVCALLYGVMYVLCKGPSPTARDLFVRSVRETSAIGFLADLYLTPEEIAAIEAGAPQEETITGTDTSLFIQETPEPSSVEEGPQPDAWGYVDEDGDGLILVEVKGESYIGYMLIVLDPSRVVLGCSPENIGIRGYTVQEFVEMNDAVAGINGGGFADPGGQGNGSMPDTLIVHGGNVYASGSGVGYGFVGIDDEYILHVGFNSTEDVYNWNIQEGCGYGPILVVNGEARDPEILASGLNPRTAIGQRADKAMLLLVIEGRQPNRLGATYTDVAEIMLSFGALNACNLDGGSSTMMWYEGRYINNSASVIGIRPIPTSFLVLKEGVKSDG